MDSNKLTKLIEVGYQLQECCGNCHFGKFAVGSSFGTCKKYSYSHLKHSDKNRQMSIHKFGRCDDGFLKALDPEANTMFAYLK